jgi:hypothetical protein
MKKNFLTNLLNLFKKKDTSDNSSEEPIHQSNNDEQNDSNKPDIIEYRETLYSDRPNQRFSKPSIERKMLFTNVQSVESDIDGINKEKSTDNGNIEKRVDSILSKKKKEIPKPSSSRKPANVIYVVSKPQPGQVKGDWAVRSHYKIFSHHRTKQAAINNARTIALEREATVLVQNTDGTFSTGFKPRKQKK